MIIPASNVKHLMLRRDVVAAAAEGRFTIFPIDTVDQGLELLTGIPAGEPDADGNYPAGTLNQRIAARLDAFAAKAAELGAPIAARPAGGLSMTRPIERVVVPLDAASENRTAIDTAARLAAARQGPAARCLCRGRGSAAARQPAVRPPGHPRGRRSSR